MTLRIHKVEKLLLLGFQVAFYIIPNFLKFVKENFHFPIIAFWCAARLELAPIAYLNRSYQLNYTHRL